METPAREPAFFLGSAPAQGISLRAQSPPGNARHPADLTIDGVKAANENPFGSTSEVCAYLPVDWPPRGDFGLS